jgi:hypothetical protein
MPPVMAEAAKARRAKAAETPVRLLIQSQAVGSNAAQVIEAGTERPCGGAAHRPVISALGGAPGGVGIGMGSEQHQPGDLGVGIFGADRRRGAQRGEHADGAVAAVAPQAQPHRPLQGEEIARLALPAPFEGGERAVDVARGLQCETQIVAGGGVIDPGESLPGGTEAGVGQEHPTQVELGRLLQRQDAEGADFGLRLGERFSVHFRQLH